MANVTVRRDNENRPTALAREPALRFDPFRSMLDLMGWDPFRELAPFATQPSTWMPTFEVKETNDGFTFKADVPGVKENDIDVTLTGNRLSISGKREAEKRETTDTYYTYERSYGDFARVFTLPDGIEPSSIHADLKDGVLTIGVKKNAAQQAKKIPVQSASKKS